MAVQMFYKKAWVEYHPLGVVRRSPVHPALRRAAGMHPTRHFHGLPADQAAPAQVGAIVPWNYPFHNVFNPLTAALFAGNGIVIKVRCQPPDGGPS